MRTLLNLRNGEVKVCQRTTGDYAVVRDNLTVTRVHPTYEQAYRHALNLTHNLHRDELLENQNG